MIILQYERSFYIIDMLDVYWRSHYGADFSHDWAASADSGDFGSQCRDILRNFYIGYRVLKTLMISKNELMAEIVRISYNMVRYFKLNDAGPINT